MGLSQAETGQISARRDFRHRKKSPRHPEASVARGIYAAKKSLLFVMAGRKGIGMSLP
jgi:hypothetical protein